MKENRFNTVEGIRTYLDSIPKFSRNGVSAANFDLDRMHKLCKMMGSPEQKFKSIHVAGTNGKGTVCRFLASVYQHAGYKTGIYTSPHLIDVTERFKINGRVIDDESLILFFTLFGDEVSRAGTTYFELTTAIAFWYFAKEKVDIALIETGLGGRLDATNVITPLASIITSIGLDHTDLLGNSIGQIAAEKAGIIKKGRPVIVGRLPSEAHRVITSYAALRGSDRVAAEACNPRYHDGNICMDTDAGSLVIRSQNLKQIDLVNAATACMTVQKIRDLLPVPNKKFAAGLEGVDAIFPQHARFEQLLPHKQWYFDGAHNPEAMHVLIEELLKRAPAEKWTVVLSLMKDKLKPELGEIWKEFGNLNIYQQEGERAATLEEMTAVLPGSTPFSGEEFFKKGSENHFKSELVIFSGSFYFYPIVRHWTGTHAKN